MKKIQRTYSSNGKTIYEFLTEEVAKDIGCLFTFDSKTRTISAYDMQNMCLNDDCDYYLNKDKKYYTGDPKTFRYRGEFTDVCPICGSNKIQFGYGQDTTILVDKENLTEGIKYDTETDEVKNVFLLTSDDDDFDAAIRNTNPAGNNYIMCITDELKKAMPQDLVTKLDEYNAAVKAKEETHRQQVIAYYEAVTKELELKHSMMPAPMNDDKRIGIDQNGEVGDSWGVLTTIKNQLNGKEVALPVSDTVSFENIVEENSYLVNSAISSYVSNFIYQQHFGVEVLSNATKTGPPYTTEVVLSNGKYITLKSCEWTVSIVIRKYSDENDEYPMRRTKEDYNNLTTAEKNSGKYYYVDSVDSNGNDVISGNPLKIKFKVSDRDYGNIQLQVSKLIMNTASRNKVNNFYQMCEYTLVNDDGTANTTYQNNYKEALTKYSLEYLNMLKECANSCRNILITLGQTQQPPAQSRWVVWTKVQNKQLKVASSG